MECIYWCFVQRLVYLIEDEHSGSLSPSIVGGTEIQGVPRVSHSKKTESERWMTWISDVVRPLQIQILLIGRIAYKWCGRFVMASTEIGRLLHEWSLPVTLQTVNTAERCWRIGMFDDKRLTYQTQVCGCQKS